MLSYPKLACNPNLKNQLDSVFLEPVEPLLGPVEPYMVQLNICLDWLIMIILISIFHEPIKLQVEPVEL